MFGYVRVMSAELKVKEYELYRGAYCGLCRSMGKCTGQCSRMTLSYDFAFLALLRSCLENTPIVLEKKRCIAHPLRKRSMAKPNDVLKYCAYAASILNYHKIKDDISDEKGFKRLAAYMLLPFVAHARKKALRAGYGELDKKISQKLVLLAEAEAQRAPSVDMPASIFGDLLSDICSYGLEGAGARIAGAIGHSVGKWIYIVDAIDDVQKDEQKGRYNPLLLLYGGRMPTKEELLSVSEALKAQLVCASDALDLVDTQNAAVLSIIENIMYLGLPSVEQKILKEDNCKKKKGTQTDDE